MSAEILRQHSSAMRFGQRGDQAPASPLDARGLADLSGKVVHLPGDADGFRTGGSSSPVGPDNLFRHQPGAAIQLPFCAGVARIHRYIWRIPLVELTGTFSGRLSSAVGRRKPYSTSRCACANGRPCIHGAQLREMLTCALVDHQQKVVGKIVQQGMPEAGRALSPVQIDANSFQCRCNRPAPASFRDQAACAVPDAAPPPDGWNRGTPAAVPRVPS